jgi:hypothetical protein
MANTPKPAGGRATASGMNFQAEVGVWFAAHLATATPLGTRFGLSATAVPVRLQFETAQFLDDIQMDLSDGSSIFVQCKTRPALSAAKDGPLADTVAQLAALLLTRRKERAEPDPSKVAAVLAVAVDASRSLDNLEAACRHFDLGATWADATGRVGGKQAAALQVLAKSAQAAWKSMKGGAPTDADLAALARLLHVVRFDVDDGGADRRNAASLIGTKLLGDEGAGAAALASLGQVVNRMTRTGAPADRAGLMQRLRSTGFSDTRSPGYDEDVKQLVTKTASELSRLARHARLPTSQNAPIPRECMAALADAIDGGSLLVIGEPGAGKTGVLMTYAESLAQGSVPLVLLSIDGLSGVTGRDMLRTELQLEHDLLDVLANWPGRQPGVLVIDALDASRGGPSELVFANVIEEGLQRLGERWSIVASIRTFDLKNGTRFRAIMAGEPPSATYRDADLMNARHFLVPRLSADEVDSLAQSHPELSRLVASAPAPLQELLRNVFNLSLAADLISGGATAESIASVTTQSDLIWKYEDARLNTDRLRVAVGDTLRAMVDKRRITVLRSRIHNEAVGDVVQSGVLALAGERIAFSHHILFDHAASRYYLEWDDMNALATQVSSDPAIGLLLGPALRFAVERAWREEGLGHADTWRLIARLCATDDIDPVVTSVGLRTAAEGVAGPKDVAGLLDLLRANASPHELATTLDRLARFVGMRAGEPGGLSIDAKTAWAAVAREGVRNLAAEYSDGVRFLLMTLADNGDFSDGEFASTFGEAARDLLSFAWSKEPDMQGLANQAISFVTASYASDVISSRTLLTQILEDPRFELHAHEETPWLAEGVATIAPVDAEFAFEIYRTIFGRNISEDGHSWLGGRPSRILALSSSRKQDYEHGRWHLKEVFPKLMEVSPPWGTRTASAVAIGTAGLEWPDRGYDPVEIALADGQRLAVVEDHRSLTDWRTERHPDNHEEVLAAFVAYLRECNGEEFRTVVETAFAGASACSVWNRILGVGAERLDIVGDLLWPVASSLPMIALRDVGRDAIIFLAAAYPSRPETERSAFEIELIEWLEGEADGEEWRVSLAARILSTVPDEALATASARGAKARLGSEGRLAGNPPYVSFQVGFGENDNIVDSMLANEGADLSKGPDKAVRDPTRELEELLRDRTGECDAPQVGQLWNAARKVLAILNDTPDGTAHTEVQRASWGAVGNAVEKIVDAKAYSPDLPHHPGLDEIIALVDRLAASPYPEPRSDQDDDSLAWGNWDVRVYAASALMDLCRQFGDRDPSLIDRLNALAFDAVPTVRLQIAQSVNTLWDVARPKMWELATRIGRDEPHLGVLGFFVGGPLRRISEPQPERAEAIADEILKRLQSRNDEKTERAREPAAEAIAGLAARLWVGRGRPAARRWIDDWVSDLIHGEPYLWALISTIRMGLFEKYVHPDDETSAGIQRRSKELADQVARTASELMRENLAEVQREDATPEERTGAEARYKVAARLLDHVSNQLYFGSGVFRHGRNDTEEDVPGLVDTKTKKAFLEDYSDTLDVIGQSGTAHTLHHLVELYGYLADASPEPVFDRVAELLVGPARREEYHFESLGSKALVRLIRRYLADHREVFQDSARRGRLVAVLELFSGAGWPEALKLLYELPDLLR